MSKIDDLVVEAKFNNGQFQAAANSTLAQLDKLKGAIKFDGKANGLEQVAQSAKSFSLAGIASAVDNLKARFSNMGIVGMTALMNISNKAVNAGLNMAKSFVLSPITDGFKEYELKMGSIQTILANTARHGTKLPEVKKALAELNDYADKTIYNFGDMTRNIGLFTNSGMKVQDATAMIKGFSNAAAASGTSSSDASRAAYQLSQALNSGVIKAQDWISITNAGMGNKNMTDGLIQIATQMGHLTKGSKTATEAQKNFKNSLSEGWLKADVMSMYLKIMAQDNKELNLAQLASIGITGKQAEAWIAQQKTAQDAATKVRTFTQLIDTLKEAIGSGWGETFEILLGDFEGATELFTMLSDNIGDVITGMSDARNKMAKDFVDQGGREAIIGTLKNLGTIVSQILGPIGKAFGEVFGTKMGSGLAGMAKGMERLTAAFKMGGAATEGLKNTFKGLFAVLHLALTIVGGVLKIVGALFTVLIKGATGASGGILVVTGAIGAFVAKLEKAITSGELWGRMWRLIEPIWAMVEGWISKINNALPKQAEVMAKVRGELAFLNRQYETLVRKLQPAVKAVQDFWDKLKPVGGAATTYAYDISKLEEAFNKLGSKIQSGAIKAYNEVLKGLRVAARGGQEAIDYLAEALGRLREKLSGPAASVKNFLGGLKKESIAAAGAAADNAGQSMQKAQGWAQKLGDGLKWMGGQLKAAWAAMQPVFAAIGRGYEQVKSKMQQWFAGFKGQDYGGLLGVAAITTAVVMIKQFLNRIDSFMEMIEKGFKGVEDVLGGLSNALNSFALKTKSEALRNVAIAIAIFAGSLLLLTLIDQGKLGGAIVAMSAIALEMAGLMVIMDSLSSSLNGGKFMAAAVGLMLMGAAMSLIAGAAVKMSKLSWSDMAKGLVTVGVLMGMMKGYATGGFGERAISAGIGLVVMASAIHILAGAVNKLGRMDMKTLAKGMGAVVIMMGSMIGMSYALSAGGKNLAIGSAGMLLMATSLGMVARSIEKLGKIDTKTLIKGTVALAASLAIMVLAVRSMPPDAAILGISMGIAIGAITAALSIVGALPMANIIKGVVGIAAALGVLVVAMNLMTGNVAGTAALIGLAVALNLLVIPMMLLSTLSWEGIAKGLVAVGGALILLAASAVLLGPLAPAMLMLAAGIGALGLAFVVFGAAALLFGTGMALAATAGVAGTAALAASILMFLAILPRVAQGIVNFVTAALTALAAAWPEIVASIQIMIQGLLLLLRNIAPDLAATVVVLALAVSGALANAAPGLGADLLRLIQGLINVVRANGPKLVSSFVKMIEELVISALRSLTNSVPRVAKAAADLIIAMINAVRQQIPRIMQAATDAVIALINSLANGIRNNGPKVREAGRNVIKALLEEMVKTFVPTSVVSKAKELGTKLGSEISNLASTISSKARSVGSNIISGVVSGINNGISSVTSAAREIGRKALEAAKGALKINSPSKVFADEVGVGMPEGTAKGMLDNVDIVEDAAETMADVAVKSMQEALKDAMYMIDTDMSVQPTIKPVLDLSEVRNGAKLIDGMVSTSGVNRVRIPKNSRGEISPELSRNAPPVVNNFEYTQNIHSPKAVSRIEIYRDTKAQLNTVAGALKR